MSSVMVLDAGNSIIKYKRTDGTEGSFVHAIKRLTEAQYKNILDRNGGKAPLDYLRINGSPFVIGESAERHGTLINKYGADRYTKDYYGHIAAAALARLYDKSGDVDLFGSHAPGDVEYRDDLMQAAVGTWDVAVGGSELTFKINYANTFDEPVGGLFNVILASTGTRYQHSQINGGRALVIDIGGRTTDWLAVSPGGVVDYSLNESTRIGIIDVIRDFERSFRTTNKEAVKGLAQLPPDRVRDAIQFGVFKGGGREYPCGNEVNEATSVLLNRISSTYNDLAGGPTPWDSIILTGGGTAMLYDKLLPILNHDHVIMADDPASIHMANVRGGLKLWRFFEDEGLNE